MQELRAALDYSPDTGILTWKRRNSVPAWANGKYAGQVAGSRSRRGRLRVGFGGELLAVARVIWAIVYGIDPGRLMVDHIDGNPANDRLNNLRLATASQNTANSRALRRALPKGVYARGGRFQAEVRTGSQRKYLGTFDTAEAAALAYKAAARSTFGEFACFEVRPEDADAPH